MQVEIPEDGRRPCGLVRRRAHITDEEETKNMFKGKKRGVIKILSAVLAMALLLPQSALGASFWGTAAADQTAAGSLASDHAFGAFFMSKASGRKTGWKKENGLWFYYENGVRVKNQWRTLPVTLSNGKTVTRKFFFRRNGAACTGVLKLNGKYYTFTVRGMLNASSNNKIYKVGDYYYCPDKNGVCRTGWIISSGKLYFANKLGRLVHDKTIGGEAGIQFKGIEAVRNVACVSKLLCLQVINRVTDSSMSKSEKLYACWRYLVDNCDYVLRYNPTLSDPLWMKRKAMEMLQSHGGDCISYACAFAGLAASLGYSPKVIHGRVPGTRDGAADGYTTHYWVLINGLQYDPEGEAAGWNWDAYATYDYTFDYQVLEVYDYVSGRETSWG